METSGNISDFLSNPVMSNSSAFCRNFSNSSSFVNMNSSRCDRTAELDKSSTPVIVAIIITALYSIVCVVGLLGNVLVMYVIIRYTKMKTATNIYIFNLALADALATSTLPFQSVNYLMGTWPFGDVLCKIVMSIDYYNMFTSIFTLTTMSVDRYIAVCHPVKALDFRTPRNAKIVNVCNWILSSAIGLPVMVMASTTIEYHSSYLRLHLRLHHARSHHHHLLRLNDSPPEECAHAVWLQGEGPQPPAHHPNGPGSGGGFHCLLDTDPHLRHHQGLGDHSQLAPADRHLAFLHRPRLHQQLPQPGALRLPGRELQALFQGVLRSQSIRAGPPELHTHQEPPARGPVQRPHGRQDESAGMTSPGNVITGVPLPAQC
ncbi:mu-type opioid receptor isoform X2 [Labeo rohita]|uniref:mu-type opioid receptor isoform X2 n=1 Tax=Labeo rohita TaxID=84645 RepID=UPI0021E2C699|nr:mu-type opioid receptor isoform X2 [Labeo rohita]